MRCPKCGYISFDHVETCLKCKKDISGKVEVEGTTYRATAPSFFKAPGRESQEEDNDFIQNDSELGDEEYDFADPDLNVLVDDDEEFGFDDDDDAGISFDDSALDVGKDDFQLEADEPDEDDDFSFDLGDDEELDGEQTSQELNVPDELSDISDLAPPETESALAATSVEDDDMSLSLDDEMDLDEDLDLDGLDLNLGLGEDTDDAGGDLSLSLDDIDISMDDDIVSSGDSDLDDLSMDLDLGDFDIEEPKAKESKSSGGLDGISLSLD